MELHRGDFAMFAMVAVVVIVSAANSIIGFGAANSIVTAWMLVFVGWGCYYSWLCWLIYNFSSILKSFVNFEK